MPEPFRRAAPVLVGLALFITLADAARADAYNAYGTVATVYPTPDGKILVQLKNTGGSTCTVQSPYYFSFTNADARIVDRWFAVLQTSYATGRRVWIQGDASLCVPNQIVPGWYVLNIDG